MGKTAPESLREPEGMPTICQRFAKSPWTDREAHPSGPGAIYYLWWGGTGGLGQLQSASGAAF
eukprot:709320-Karenia_brevis.AAC.1